MSPLNTIIVLIAVSAVAIADVLLKKAQSLGSLTKAIMSPLMLGAVVLYLVQIFFFMYLFMSGEKLTQIGIIQTVLYAVIVLGSGILFFGETLTGLQICGVILAITGIVLIQI